jgi:hypothetical protein
MIGSYFLVVKENGAECLVLSASGDFANNRQFRQELSALILAVLFEVLIISLQEALTFPNVRKKEQHS